MSENVVRYTMKNKPGLESLGYTALAWQALCERLREALGAIKEMDEIELMNLSFTECFEALALTPEEALKQKEEKQ